MQKLTRSALALVMLTLAMGLIASAASAQRSQLELQVHDMNGAELGPVNVTVYSPQGEIVLQEATRKNGRLRFRLAVLEEPYRVLLQKDGHPDREVEVQMVEGRDRSLTVQLWDEATATKQQAIDAFNEAIGRIQAGDATGALPLFEKAVELDSTIADAYRMIAAIRHNMGQLAEALEPAGRYLEMAPMPPEMASMFFDIFAAADDPRAEDAKQLAIEAGNGAELAPGVFAQGVQAVRGGDDERAVELFREAASLNPRLYQAYRNIGTLYFNDGKFEESPGGTRPHPGARPGKPGGAEDEVLLLRLAGPSGRLHRDGQGVARRQPHRRPPGPVPGPAALRRRGPSATRSSTTSRSSPGTTTTRAPTSGSA